METTNFSGKKLRALRLSRGLTQAELAHRAHVRERQVIRWENDQHVPRLGSLRALARVLEARTDDFFADSDGGGDQEDEDVGEPNPVSDLARAVRALTDELRRGREGRERLVA